MVKEFDVILPRLAITPREFFTLFYSDNSSFVKDFHTARGDTGEYTMLLLYLDLTQEEILVGVWVDDKTGKKRREIHFRSPTSNNSMIKRLAGTKSKILIHFLGDTVSVTETQYYSFRSE
jgi:hypothetical protein